MVYAEVSFSNFVLIFLFHDTKIIEPDWHPSENLESPQFWKKSEPFIRNCKVSNKWDYIKVGYYGCKLPLKGYEAKRYYSLSIAQNLKYAGFGLPNSATRCDKNDNIQVSPNFNNMIIADFDHQNCWCERGFSFEQKCLF